MLNLLNMGRGKGIHAIFGTQGLADLEKVDVIFKKSGIKLCQYANMLSAE